MVVQARRGRGRLLTVGVVVVVIIALAASLARFYTDVLWFNEIGFASVLWTSLRTQFGVGLAAGVLAALVVWVNLVLANRLAPPYRIPRFDQAGRPDPLDRYRELLAPYGRWVRLAIAAVIGLLSGVAASSSWQIFLLWANRVDFGVRDPQFDRDVGFYVFELPFLDALLDGAWFALLAALLLTVASYYISGAIRPRGGLGGIESAALAHISVLLGLLALVKAGQYWLGRYHLNFSPRGVVTGASYTDVNAQLPALTVLMIIAIISALLFIANIWVRRIELPLATVGIWILIAVLAGGVWPWWVQRFSVEPQELQRERPFIERNIDATREAFGLGGIESVEFAAGSDLTPADLEPNQLQLANVRVWDPEVLQRAYKPLQAIRTYYDFEDVDIDRYEVDGEMRQVLLSARELSLDDLPSDSQKWPNLHLQYTHGFGLVASLANATTAAGQPDFLVQDVPGTVEPEAGSLEVEQPRIYFGEAFDPNEYSIVDSKQEEIDYETEDAVVRSRYDGEGGVPIGGLLKRLAFAIRESDPNLILSNLITGDSKIVFYKNLRDRVLRTAPFLELDGDPYLAVVDGRLLWIVDAYTSTPWYPYSQRFDVGEEVNQALAGTMDGEVNYVRNSVKVTVDAYDGTMKFHIIDPDDPLIQAWRNAFPDLFTDDEPSESLIEHFRYPEDYFKVQSEVYLTYHMTEPDSLFARVDQWDVPRNPQLFVETGSEEVQPTYLLTSLPGDLEPSFILTRPFTPIERQNMIALMVARSDPEDYGELLTLQFPRQETVLGPVQVDNLINQDPEVSQALTLLGQEGSRIGFGKLVILPIEESILYVQPLFLTAAANDQTTVTGQTTATTGIPELKRVVTVLGEEVGMGENFETSLSDLFGLDITEPGEPEVPPEEPDEPGPGDEPQPGVARQVAELINRAARLYERAQEALADGDFATYGKLIERLGRLISEAESLSR